MAVGGDDKDDARFEGLGLVLGDGANRKDAAFGEDFDEIARTRGIQVLSDDQGNREVGGDGGDEDGERLDPAGRGANDDQLRECLWVRHQRGLLDGFMTAKARTRASPGRRCRFVSTLRRAEARPEIGRELYPAAHEVPRKVRGE